MLREQAGIVRELASNPAYSDIREELLVLAGRREQEALLRERSLAKSGRDPGVT
jgi:hypothetical protein